jgi:CRP/FNR family transcriptional regulator, cyclic AMP receptor protein
MKGIEELIAQTPFFQGLDEETLGIIAACAKNVHFREGDLLFRTDEAADRCFVLRSGRVALEIVGGSGDAMIVDTVEAGDLVGLAWLVPPYRWYMDARAVEPVSAVDFDASCLRTKCELDTRVGYLLMQRVASTMHERIRSARVRLLDLYGVPNGG